MHLYFYQFTAGLQLKLFDIPIFDSRVHSIPKLI